MTIVLIFLAVIFGILIVSAALPWLLELGCIIFSILGVAGFCILVAACIGSIIGAVAGIITKKNTKEEEQWKEE